MKNKIFLTAVIACAFMFINCSDNTNKEKKQNLFNSGNRMRFYVHQLQR